MTNRNLVDLMVREQFHDLDTSWEAVVWRAVKRQAAKTALREGAVVCHNPRVIWNVTTTK
jgi:hypothetical protein